MTARVLAIASIALAGLVGLIAGAITAGPRTVHVLIEQSNFVEGGALVVRA